MVAVPLHRSDPDALIQSHRFPFLVAIPSRFGTFDSFNSFNIV
jgi:hypothetical protein